MFKARYSKSVLGSGHPMNVTSAEGCTRAGRPQYSRVTRRSSDPTRILGLASTRRQGRRPKLLITASTLLLCLVTLPLGGDADVFSVPANGRDVGDEVTNSPRRQPPLLRGSQDERAGIEGDGNHGGGGGGGVRGSPRQRMKTSCSPLKIIGTDHCPGWEGTSIVQDLLRAKREMLKGIVQLLEDPASAGPGGDPERPLMLVQEIAVDEADMVMGASLHLYLGKASDSASWNLEIGSFNRWLARYYDEVLHRSRPVVVTVHGDDVCALEMELSLEGRERAPVKDLGRRSERSSWYKEDFDVPIVLMTLGWDPAGDPTKRGLAVNRDVSCALRVLNLPRVKLWFTSHSQSSSQPHSKLRFLPLGFGGFYTRSGLNQFIYLENAKHQLRVMQECDESMEGRFDLLFECNTMEREVREKIWEQMTLDKADGQPVPVNRCPLPPKDMVFSASMGIFAVSPPGTGPDCFRHYEMMVEGNIVLVPDVESLRSFMGGLPVFFLGKDTPWGGLTCDKLAEMAGTVERALNGSSSDRGEGWGLMYEKLTHGYWRKYVRQETVKAGGGDSSAPYMERSAAPLDPPGWSTYRRIGCYQLSEDEMPKRVGEGSSPEKCAGACSGGNEMGTGFFGVTTDGGCWCGDEIGRMVSEDRCHKPEPCHHDENHEGEESECVDDGAALVSSVYVFGPPDGPLEYDYYGCFPQSDRYLYHIQSRFSYSLTPEICEAFCVSHRYPFFGLQRSAWCRCGTMTRNTGSSVREPAYAQNDPFLEILHPDISIGGRPWPGARVGDPVFQCIDFCAGNETMLGCGGGRAWDLYAVKDPCLLYRDCEP